jgi:hypothetical protein
VQRVDGRVFVTTTDPEENAITYEITKDGETIVVNDKFGSGGWWRLR